MTTIKDKFRSSLTQTRTGMRKSWLSCLLMLTCWLPPARLDLTITPEKLLLYFIFALITSSLLSPVFSQSFKTPFLLRLSFKGDWEEEHWLVLLDLSLSDPRLSGRYIPKFASPRFAYIIRASNCHPICKRQRCVTENVGVLVDV